MVPPRIPLATTNKDLESDRPVNNSNVVLPVDPDKPEIMMDRMEEGELTNESDNHDGDKVKADPSSQQMHWTSEATRKEESLKLLPSPISCTPRPTCAVALDRTSPNDILSHHLDEGKSSEAMTALMAMQHLRATTRIEEMARTIVLFELPPDIEELARTIPGAFRISTICTPSEEGSVSSKNGPVVLASAELVDKKCDRQLRDEVERLRLDLQASRLMPVVTAEVEISNDNAARRNRRIRKRFYVLDHDFLGTGLA